MAPKTKVKPNTEQIEATPDLPYVIIRGDRSGAFAGYLESRTGREVTLKQSRRLWYWYGAASLSEMAVSGTKKPKDCKFPAAVDHHEILDALEVISCTEQARKSIQEVPVWSA